jgi:hypothetical protein
VTLSVQARETRRPGASAHESFLRHARFRWLIVAIVASTAATAGYLLIDFEPRPSGGTWYGYTLGTVGALLILWLTALGVRKRAVSDGRYSLKAWVSAHVYLGLSLLVIATLHTAFQFGWNVHTLAYALMVLVIVSGLVGVVAYARLPRRLSANRGETTQKQMLETIRSLDRRLHEAAQPLDQQTAAFVRLSIECVDVGGGFWRRLAGWYGDCANREAIRRVQALDRAAPPARREALEPVLALLERKAAALAQARRHIGMRARLEAWLFVHVPATFALLAALTAHIVSIFFYW